MWTLRPLTSSEERRKSQRRSGVGRRVLGDRRMADPVSTPGNLPSGWKRRQGERRVSKRRVIRDRRGNGPVS